MSDKKAPIPATQRRWITLAARIGLVAIGIVYSLIGILTLSAAFDLGRSGTKGNVSQVLDWLQAQPLGQVLLGLITVGMLCYSLWRVIQAIYDTDNKGNSIQGLAIRASFLSYGLVYGSFTFYAAQLLLGTSKGVENTRQTVAYELLTRPFGQWMLGIVALFTLGTGIYQIYLSLSGDYRRIVQESPLDTPVQEMLIKTGKIGYIARGLVWLVLGYFLIEAAIQVDASEAGDSDAALDFMEREYGSLPLALVSLGLVCYGVFMFVRARFQPIINSNRKSGT
ncbi:DUF1206 domain-containing protein [Arundinibacter roseus]|uniref:DUF1206 domain-containing protein n=1 Tax=Arundinibacter roseus TaxID=2070510 RepID=A0A4R4K8I2_9BACT|nr:DUF1206 domain-containing protein [Arundinibacter roseus]TDB63733.1 DUF1206 domain-containing protein [Arundinibacter roseus]